MSINIDDVVSKIISSLVDLKYDVMNSVADNVDEFVIDTDFIDAGIIESKVELLKKQLSSANTETQKRKISDEIVMLLSNLENSLINDFEEVSNYFENCDRDLIEFVKILRSYLNGEDVSTCFFEIEKFVECKEKHFLFNKIKGVLLLEDEKYSEAIKYLRQAISLMPEDLESYHYLLECYEKTLHEEEKNLIEEMILLLDGETQNFFEEWDYEEE